MNISAIRSPREGLLLLGELLNLPLKSEPSFEPGQENLLSQLAQAGAGLGSSWLQSGGKGLLQTFADGLPGLEELYELFSSGLKLNLPFTLRESSPTSELGMSSFDEFGVFKLSELGQLQSFGPQIGVSSLSAFSDLPGTLLDLARGIDAASGLGSNFNTFSLLPSLLPSAANFSGSNPPTDRAVENRPPRSLWEARRQPYEASDLPRRKVPPRRRNPGGGVFQKLWKGARALFQTVSGMRGTAK